MRRPEVVLFDLDGTLTDPRAGITGSYQHALATVGVVVSDPEELTWMIGPPLRANLLAAGVTGDDLEVAAAAYRERHWAVGLYQASVIDGIPELLADLHAAGVRMALATGKATAQGIATLEHFGLDRWFEVVAGAEPDEGRVEKDSIVAHVLRGLSFPPVETVVMVGDRRFDIEGAQAAGIRAVAVTWGYALPGEMDAAGPDAVVSTVDELRALLLD